MKEQSIDKQIQDYYHTKQLRPVKLEALLKLAENSQPRPFKRDIMFKRLKSVFCPNWFRRRGLALTAAVLAVVFMSVYIWETRYTPYSKLAALASREIALNHNKRLALEFKARDYIELYAQMNRLGFTPLPPKRVQDAGLTLVGARYCSILGQLACQYKLLGENGEYYTLYQTELNDELSRLPEREYRINGVVVQQWQEAGFFFGMAKNYH